MNAKVIYEGLVLKGTLPSGAGDNLLTVDPSTGVVGSISGAPLTTTLPSGQIFVGNASNVATAVAVSGDITISNTGNAQIVAGVIVNADINATAAIEVTKLQTLTVSRAVVTNVSGFLTTSTATATEVGYLSGVTSSIQTQINGKQATITGGATTITTSDLTASRALVSNASGKVAVSSTTSTELGYVSGVTSPIQTQLDTKLTVTLTSPNDGDMLYESGGVYVNLPIGPPGTVLTAGVGGTPTWVVGTSNGIPNAGSTGQYLAKQSNADYDVAWTTLTLDKVTDVTATVGDVNILTGADAAGITSTEFSYINGVTSSIQTQLDNKLSNSLPYNAIFRGDAGNQAVAYAAGDDGDILKIVAGVPTWTPETPPGNVSGVAPSTDNAIARWNGTAADSIQNSGVIIDDTNNITGVATMSSGQLSVLNQAAVRLYETGSTNYVGIRASGVMASDYTITLPAAAPTSGTFLQYDGANYVWAAAAPGTLQREQPGTTYTIQNSDNNYIIYFTDVAGCTVTIPDTLNAGVRWVSVRADGAGTVDHVASGSATLFTINGDTDIQNENTAAEWVVGGVDGLTTDNIYGFGALGAGGGGGGSGTVTSIDVSGGTTGLSFSGGPVTTSGTITMGGTLTEVNGGTNQTSYAQGDILYASAINTLSKLAKDTNATRYLSNTGTSNNPAWAQINLANGVTGDLPFANLTQGSGLSVLGVTGASTADFASIAAGSDHNILRRSGSSLDFGSINLAQTGAVGSSVLGIANGGTGSTLGAWILGGNALGSASVVGSSTDFNVTLQTGVANLLFRTNSVDRMTIQSTGETVIGTTAPHSIDTSHTMRVLSGDVNTFILQNTSGSVSHLFRPDSVFNIGASAGFAATNVGGATESVTGTTLRISGPSTWSTTSGTSVLLLQTASSSTAATTLSTFKIAPVSGVSFNPTSGSTAFTAINLNTAINQTGTASGVITGINYNPTLTSVLGAHYGLLIQPTGARSGFGTATPTAKVHIAAGSATANTAPLKLTSGTALTTPEDGAMEYHSSHLYFTIGSTRYQLDQQGGGISGLTSGRVPYANSSTTITDEAGFEYDSSTNTLSVEAINLGVAGTGGTSRAVSAVGSGGTIDLQIKSKGSAGVIDLQTSLWKFYDNQASSLGFSLNTSSNGTVYGGKHGIALLTTASAVTLTAETNPLATLPGDFTISAGGQTGTTARGSHMIVTSGASGAASQPSGNLSLLTADATVGGDANSGDILIQTGDPLGAGVAGNIAIDSKDSTTSILANAVVIQDGNALYGGGRIAFPVRTGDFVSAGSALNIWNQDTSDGDASLAIYTEQDVESSTGTPSTHALKIKINGTEYRLLLEAV